MFLFKDSANERNESLLSNSRVQPILFKDSANERNESLLSNIRVQPILFKDNLNPCLFQFWIGKSGMSFYSKSRVNESDISVWQCLG